MRDNGRIFALFNVVADIDGAALCRDIPTEFDDDELVGMVSRLHQLVRTEVR